MEQLNDVRFRHVRNMVEDIAKRKDVVGQKVNCLEKWVKYSTLVLSILVTIQTILNVLQGSDIFPERQHIRIVAVIGTILGVLIACIGKQVFDVKRTLITCVEQLQLLEKTEDMFMMELDMTLEDGNLSADEYKRLIKMMGDVRNVMSHGSVKNFHLYHKNDLEDGAGNLLPTGSRVLHGTPHQHQDRSEEHSRQVREETLFA